MRHSNLRAFGSKPNALRCFKLLRIEEVGSPGRIRTYSLSVNSLVPDLITIVPEPRQIEGNQQVLAKWAESDLPSLCGLYSLFAAIHHNSYDTGMTLQIFRFGTKKLDPKSSLYRPSLPKPGS